MAGPTIEVNDADFEEKVINSATPVLVDFWAEWCGPCHMVAPVLEEIASEKQGTLTIAKLDIDANPETARRFGILSIPSMVLFIDGVEKRRLVGARGKAAILGELSEFVV
ncbi:MAG: thioredoxin [Actinomycetota bacterium]